MSGFYQPTLEAKKQSAERVAAIVAAGVLPPNHRDDHKQRERFLEAERQDAGNAKLAFRKAAKGTTEE